MKVPICILDVFNDPEGLDRLFSYYLPKAKTMQEAYDQAIEEIEKYAPNAKFYSDYENYKDGRHKKIRKARGTYIEVPLEVLRVLGNKEEFEELYWRFYRAHNSDGPRAFKAMMEYLHKWVPNYRPYANADSFRKSINRKRKRRD